MLVRVNSVDDRLDRIDRRRWRNPVPKIENVPRPSSRATKHGFGVFNGDFFGCQQKQWIKIALNRVLIANALPRLIEFNAPIYPHDRTASIALLLK